MARYPAAALPKAGVCARDNYGQTSTSLSDVNNKVVTSASSHPPTAVPGVGGEEPRVREVEVEVREGRRRQRREEGGEGQGDERRAGDHRGVLVLCELGGVQGIW